MIQKILPTQFKNEVATADRYRTERFEFCLPNNPSILESMGYPKYVIKRDDGWSIATTENALSPITQIWQEWGFLFNIYESMSYKTFQDASGLWWAFLRERNNLGTLVYPQVGRGTSEFMALFKLESKIQAKSA